MHWLNKHTVTEAMATSHTNFTKGRKHLTVLYINQDSSPPSRQSHTCNTPHFRYCALNNPFSVGVHLTVMMAMNNYSSQARQHAATVVRSLNANTEKLNLISIILRPTLGIGL